MREQGTPIGKIDSSLSPEEAITKIRKERLNWVQSNNTHKNPICSKNCLDVCIDYNNKVKNLNPNNPKLKQHSNKSKVIPIVPI